jgi:hypothetical protein
MEHDTPRIPEVEVTKKILTKIKDFWQLAIHKRGFFLDLGFHEVPYVYTTDLFPTSEVPFSRPQPEMSLTKLSLAGNNGDGKIANLSYIVERQHRMTEEQEDRNPGRKREGRTELRDETLKGRRIQMSSLLALLTLVE